MENAEKTTPFGGPGRGFESHLPRQRHGCRRHAASRYAAVAQSDRAGKRFLDSCFHRRRFSVSMSWILILPHRRACLSMSSLAALGTKSNKCHFGSTSSAANAGGTTLLMSRSRVRIPPGAARPGSSARLEQETFRHFLSRSSMSWLQVRPVVVLLVPRRSGLNALSRQGFGSSIRSRPWLRSGRQGTNVTSVSYRRPRMPVELHSARNASSNLAANVKVGVV